MKMSLSFVNRAPGDLPIDDPHSERRATAIPVASTDPDVLGIGLMAMGRLRRGWSVPTLGRDLEMRRTSSSPEWRSRLWEWRSSILTSDQTPHRQLRARRVLPSGDGRNDLHA